MGSDKVRGNDPPRWEKLLAALDEKLQLGLLDHLRRIPAYHFEEELLIIEPASDEEYVYWSRQTTMQQLELLARDAAAVEKIKLRKPTTN